jgi:hypothetical protein
MFLIASSTFWPSARTAPDAPQFVFVLEEMRKLAEQAFDELRRRHGPSVRAPELCRDHVLNGALLAVGELDLDFFRPAVLVPFAAIAWGAVAHRRRLAVLAVRAVPALAARRPIPGR